LKYFSAEKELALFLISYSMSRREKRKAKQLVDVPFLSQYESFVFNLNHILNNLFEWGYKSTKETCIWKFCV